jgi:two-component system, sensor histidine kinase LadS
MRSFWLLVCLVVSAWGLPAAAAVGAQVTIESLGNWPAAVTVEQIAATQHVQPIAYTPDKLHANSHEKPLWLRIRAVTDQTDMTAGWLLAFSKPSIDRIDVYTPAPEGGWRVQTAGDRIAHTQWPRNSLAAQFSLPALTLNTPQEFYVRVTNSVPLRFDMRLQRTEVLAVHNQHDFLFVGLILGLIAVMFTVSSVMASTYRSISYAWYSVWVGLGFFVSASYIGFANYAFWPNATRWSDIATASLMLVGLVVQVQFCRVMFLTQLPAKWVHRCITAAQMLGLLAAAYILRAGAITPTASLMVVAANVLYSLLMLTIVLYAIRKSNQVAWLWLAAYIPLLGLMIMAMIDNLGWIALPWLPYNAPVYAQIFEMPLLLLALHLHAKSQHQQDVQDSVLASINPLTGFVVAQLFQATAEKLWERARRDKHDLVVTYVEATSDAQRPLQRTVRLLRTVVRDTDMVAHADSNLFAILMPQKSVDDALSNKLSRLVALGHMTEKDHSEIHPVHFRIVASSLNGYDDTWQAMDAALRRKLKEPIGWGPRRIRFVTKHSAENFEALWLRAVAADALKS